MGAGDLTAGSGPVAAGGPIAGPAGPTEAEVAAFAIAGRYLAARGLVRGSEGNLSTCDGRRLLITRTGCELGALGPRDVLAGTLTVPPEGASSDLAIHLRHYRDDPDVGAVVHAHPAGTVPQGWVEGEAHGAYAVGATVEVALAGLEVHLAFRAQGSARAGPIGRVAWAGPLRLGFERESWTRGGGPTVRRGPFVSILDQTCLPRELAWLSCRTAEEVADAIRRMAVRGAPILGIAAASGVVLAAFVALERDEDVREAASKAGEALVATRPTAVNIRWAVERVLASASPAADDHEYAEALLAETRAIRREDAEACSTMGRLGAGLVGEGANVLTHCNTGMLCTAGIGTAFGLIWCAHLDGKGIHVWADETRPALQGARLTAWELERLGVPFDLVVDSAAGSLMARGLVDLVAVGADRITSNGDVVNKVGTYGLAVLARHHGIPFYVVAPTSTIDLGAGWGGDVTIEERDPAEVTSPGGGSWAPLGVPARNPAFDVTPASLVTAIVTEAGVIREPLDAGLQRVAGAGRARGRRP